MTEIQGCVYLTVETEDIYFTRYLQPLLCELGDSEKAAYIGNELTKFEMVEDRLAEWAARGDGSENPYDPPLEPKVVSSIIKKLNRQRRIVVSLQTIDCELRARSGLV